MRIRFLEKAKLISIEKLADIVGTWWIKHIIIPVITVIPFAVINFQIKASSGKDGAAPPNASFWSDLPGYASEYPYMAIIISAVYLIFVNAIVNKLVEFKSVREEEGGVSQKELLKLFEVLEVIVAQKSRRFGNASSELLAANGRASTPAEVFKAITQPNEQIALLIYGLYAFFDAIDKKGVSFKVTIVKIENGKPVDWLFHYPEDPPPSTEMVRLQSKESSISSCLAKKKILVVDSISDELSKAGGRRYIARISGESEEGSLLCYPVAHRYTNDIPYVITVVADQDGYFSSDKAKLYEWVFKHFAVRICLEQSLLVIKGRVEENESQDIKEA